MDYLQKKSIRSVAAAIAGFLRHCVRKIGITREKLPSCIALAVCPLVTFYLFELYTHNPFTTMHFKTQILNMAFYVLTALLLFGIVKYVRAALMLQTAFFMAAGLANYYVLNFRSAPIMPWDIYSIGTAASVAGNFNYTLKGSTVLVIIGFLILLLIESRFHMKAPARVAKRAALILLSIVLIYGYTGMIQSESFVRSFGLYDKLFTPTVMNKRDGNIVAFLMELEYMDVEKPSGYSPEETGSKYTQAGQDSAGLTAAVEDPESVKRPNIIVIMDEAFSDLAVRGDFTTNEDYMPFIHRLQQGAENTRTGYLNVSVLGGNTANTEFEFLTGNTIGFLPQGSVAYQQYVQKETPSLASYLKELDYHTVAIHPYYASGWDRDRVYPLLGFDEFLSQDDFTNPKRIRNYISDESSFAKIIELYENKKEGEPLFVFNVTMQNHSGYEEEFHNFTPDITLASIKPDTTDPGQKKLLTFDITGDEVTPGQSLNVSVGQKSANYDLIVPNSAIREDSNGKFILIVESKSSPLGNRYVATRVDVEVLASDDTQSAVSGALYGYEFVITTSTQPVEAGKLVRLANNS